MAKRRVPPDKAREAIMGGEVDLRGFYSRIAEPETTWPACGTCGTRARILDTEYSECIKCQVQRVKRNREGLPTTSGLF